MARAFRFPLQALLDRRVYDEQRAESLVTAAAHAYEEVRHEIDCLTAAMELQFDELSRRHGSLSIWERQIFERHIGSLERDVERAGGRATQRLAELDVARMQLQRAGRARGVIEHLRDRAKRCFVEREARLEEVEIDDANARLHERAHRRSVASR